MNQKYFENQMRNAQLENAQMQNMAMMKEMQHPMQHEEHPGIVKEQLSLGDELLIIDNLLRSHELVYNSDGSTEWKEPLDEDKILLSEKGVHFFRRIISAYMNKNTLLSNYDEETILMKMKDLATVINDRLFTSYEVLFRMPSTQRVLEEIKNNVREQLELKKAFYEVFGQEFTESKAAAFVDTELERLSHDFDRVFERVKNKLFKQKLNDFEFLLRWIQDFIHSAYLRALGGQERRSLRQTLSVTETSGGFNLPTNKPRKGGLFSGGWK